MKLTNDTAYKSIKSGIEMILTEDIDGKWYLKSHRGATKSITSNEMINNLNKHWKAI